MSTLVSTELHYSSGAGEKLATARKSFWKNLLQALMESRQRQAEREVERFIHLYGGGKITDDVERQIEQRLMRG